MKKGFTLIELLVVIAIIGLLASIVLVSMSGMQGKAKITKTLEFSQSLQRNLGAYAVGIWSFDDQTNPTKDSSGYNNHGTLVNGPTFTSDTPHLAAGVGTGKYALSFDGVNDYVDAGNGASLALTTGATWSAWVKVPDTTGHWLFDKTGYDGLRMDSRLIFNIQTDAGSYTEATALDVITANKWHYIVFTFDGTKPIGQKLGMYVDGVDKTPTNSRGGTTLNTGSDNLIIGYRSAYPADTFEGLMDEVRIYEKALTLGEIQKHYADGLGHHQNLAVK